MQTYGEKKKCSQTWHIVQPVHCVIATHTGLIYGRNDPIQMIFYAVLSTRVAPKERDFFLYPINNRWGK